MFAKALKPRFSDISVHDNCIRRAESCCLNLSITQTDSVLQTQACIQNVELYGYYSHCCCRNCRCRRTLSYVVSRTSSYVIVVVVVVVVFVVVVIVIVVVAVVVVVLIIVIIFVVVVVVVIS